MAAIAIMLILSTVGFQVWRDVLRRDKEAEMMFRAQDIVRALKRYRQDQGGTLPQELKKLADPGSRGQYFIRKVWTDPLVKDGKWGLIFLAPQGGVVDPNAPSADQQPETALGGSSKIQPSSLGMPVTGFQGQTDVREIGGLPIAGVKSLSKDKPFRVYRDQSDYAQWLFTIYDLDQQQQGTGGTPAPGGSGVPGTNLGAGAAGQGVRNQPAPGAGR